LPARRSSRLRADGRIELTVIATKAATRHFARRDTQTCHRQGIHLLLALIVRNHTDLAPLRNKHPACSANSRCFSAAKKSADKENLHLYYLQMQACRYAFA